MLVMPVTSNGLTQTVCPTCDFTTLAGCIAGAADICELQADITESIALSSNLDEIRSDATIRTWNSTGVGNTLRIQGGLSQAFALRRLKMTKTAGNGDTVLWDAVSSGAVVSFIQCEVSNLNTKNKNVIGLLFTSSVTPLLIIDRTEIIGEAGKVDDGINMSDLTGAHAVTI